MDSKTETPGKHLTLDELQVGQVFRSGCVVLCVVGGQSVATLMERC